MLRGGDRRSIGCSNQVAAEVLRKPSRFAELIECLWLDDEIVRMRAADAAEKISAKIPGILAPFKHALLALADEATQPEMRWHLALMIPRLPLSLAEKTRATSALRSFLNDRSSIVKTFAIQGLTELSRGQPDLEADVIDLLESACRSGTPAMKARSHKLLKQLNRTNQE
jgi:hypothetical protein